VIKRPDGEALDVESFKAPASPAPSQPPPWPKLPSRHLRTLRIIHDPSSNDEDVTPTFEPAGLEDEMKAWRVRGNDHNDDDDDDDESVQYYDD
jgi:hypothetical protein